MTDRAEQIASKAGRVFRYIVMLICFFCIATGVFYMLCRLTADPEVKPGQVWVFPREYAENPFADRRGHEYLVLDVKDGYVKFKILGNNKEESGTIRYFLIGAALVKEPEIIVPNGNCFLYYRVAVKEQVQASNDRITWIDVD